MAIRKRLYINCRINRQEKDLSHHGNKCPETKFDYAGKSMHVYVTYGSTGFFNFRQTWHALTPLERSKLQKIIPVRVLVSVLFIAWKLSVIECYRDQSYFI
jgi:hypothetical protein